MLIPTLGIEERFAPTREIPRPGAARINAKAKAF